MARNSTTDKSAQHDRYLERLGAEQLTPLWVFFHDWFTQAPRPRAQPHLWSYRGLRDLVLESAELVDTEEAERRVLALENPGLNGRHLATDSLYAGLQLILPGEVAPCHRHSPAALRFVIESNGAYTAVDGKRADMKPGDFIVTPAWTWHEHGHEGDGPTIWLDVLDVAMVHLFNATFTELHPARQLATASAPQNQPQSDQIPATGTSDVFHYPYTEAREALDRLKRSGEWDDSHGLRLEYTQPSNNAPAIPTISTYLQLVPQSAETGFYRSTAGTIFCVVEGRGTVEVLSPDGAAHLAYEPRDIFVVPSWHRYRILAGEETTLFSASDQVAQTKLGLWREQRGLDGN